MRLNSTAENERVYIASAMLIALVRSVYQEFSTKIPYRPVCPKLRLHSDSVSPTKSGMVLDEQTPFVKTATMLTFVTPLLGQADPCCTNCG